jgi:hypothetical protein
VTFTEGEFTFDIASVAANQPVGAVGEGATLPPGTYTNMRIEISRTFGLTGSANVPGEGTVYTDSNNTTPVSYSTMSNISTATVGSGTATKQSVSVPTGIATADLTAAGLEELPSGNLRFSVAAAFILPEGNTVSPSLGIKFNVTNAMDFLRVAPGVVIVTPVPPAATITVGA